MELVMEGLVKRYGDKTAVDGVSLRLHPGINGLLGANGAGKTTLMRMLCGILKPTSGTIMLDGLDVGSEDYRALLGYLPQDFGYYPDFTGRDFLLYLAALKGMSKSHAKRRSEELLELVGLQEVTKKKVKTYSGGMKQRLGIAQALLNDPKLLIVDEPTAGLDPKERVRFRNLMAELGKDSIVLLSTHIVSDVERIADHVLIMREGKIVYDEAWDKNRTDLEQFYLSEFDGDDFV
jgi:ABC-2 type transport system ATP-binding protein